MTFEFTTDSDRIDQEMVHRFLTGSYWAQGIDRETVARSMKGSLCFGILRNGDTVGFGRVVTDGTTFGYIADVFVLSEHRGKGLGKRLVEEMLGSTAHLAAAVGPQTRDAHHLYRRLGFRNIAGSSTWMERVRTDHLRHSMGS